MTRPFRRLNGWALTVSRAQRNRTEATKTDVAETDVAETRRRVSVISSPLCPLSPFVSLTRSLFNFKVVDHTEIEMAAFLLLLAADQDVASALERRAKPRLRAGRDFEHTAIGLARARPPGSSRDPRALLVFVRALRQPHDQHLM